LACYSLGERVLDLCPRCRTERIGAFRFCRYCRFDFDALDSADGGTASGPPRAQWRFPVRGLLALGFIVAIGASGLSTAAVPDRSSPTTEVAAATAVPKADKQVAAARRTTPSATVPPTPTQTETLAAGPTGTTTKATVVGVIDGDTIVVVVSGKRYEVTYLGMRAPASVGQRAKVANGALVAGKTVMLEKGSGADKSSRLSRYVWLQKGRRWTLVNLELVRRGFATLAATSVDKRYSGLYRAAERHARAAHLGLWAPAPPAKTKPNEKPNEKPKPTEKPPKASKAPAAEGRPAAQP
jgi:endonuclease YncB( thermonuclease family)